MGTRLWADQSAEVSSQNVGLVVRFHDLFRAGPPSRVPRVQLLVWQPKLNRNGQPVGGPNPNELLPTEYRGYTTLGGNVTFPALDRRGTPTVETRFHLVIDAPGYAVRGTVDGDPVWLRDFITGASEQNVDPASLVLTNTEFVIGAAQSSPVVRTVLLCPTHDYQFSPFTPVIRGVIHNAERGDSYLIRATPDPTATIPALITQDQAMTLTQSAPRPLSSGTTVSLPFRLGLRTGRRPNTVDVLNTRTGQVTSESPPVLLSDLLEITLP